MEVRVRFAPSPTGPLHIGGVRTALFNYLFAKNQGGKFILRIEDTDQTRFVEGAEAYIKESLAWAGIDVDEGPDQGGEYGPYRQSERKPMYMEYAQKLIDEDKAYYAFDTSEELDAMRERLKAARVASPQYNSITRETMKNSLTLPEDEVKKRLESGDPYVIRLKVPRKEEIRLNDMVRGWVMVHSSAIDDKVLMKSDGMPTYHLANVVDDHLMKVTHVIRGEEWLPSAPLHVLLYQYLGWEDSMPEFAHLPLILKPDGNGKLSKRDGDKLGFPVFPINWMPKDGGELFQGFREQGYLSSAFINFLAFLGWNPGTTQELFTLPELIDEFKVERIGKAGTKFDIDKAKWFNQQYLKNIESTELAKMLESYLEEEGLDFNKKHLPAICELLKERVLFPQDLLTDGKFFFEDPKEYDQKVVKKKWNKESVDVFEEYIARLDEIEHFDHHTAKAKLIEVLDEKGLGIGKVMQALRVAVTGKGMGPDLMPVLEILGKEKVKSRIERAIDILSEKITP